MRRLFNILMGMAVLLTAAGVVAAGDEFRARATGDAEVPPVITDTTGKVRVEFNNDETEAEFRLEVREGVRVTQAHLHCAPADTNGPIVVFLAGFHALGWEVDGTWVKDVTFTDQNILPPSPGACPDPIENLSDLAQALRNGNIYVNVHTVAHPPGEVRGQLMMVSGSGEARDASASAKEGLRSDGSKLGRKR